MKLPGPVLGGLVVAAALFHPGPARAEDKSAVSPNHLKLPTGPGSLEGVGENAQINYSMGLMSWGMDLAVPEGREGLTPKLRLDYSSGEGRSTVGIGWSLGTPSIERMTVHGLPTYTTADTFGAGSTELVFVGTQGNDRLYRARFEGGFVRYTWKDPTGADWWKAELPDGTVQFFGADRNGATAPAAREDGPLGTFRYRLVEVTNPWDQFLHYDYVKSSGASLLAGAQWIFLNGTPRYAFQVRYEDREDHLVDAKPGFAITVDKRVDDILVTTNGMQRNRYDFFYESYAESGGLSRLAGIRTYGTDDVEAHGVRFDFSYANTTVGACATPGCFSPAVVAMPGSIGPALFAGEADLVDMNGDSLPDVLDTSNGTHGVHLNTLAADGTQRFDAEVTLMASSASLAAPGVRMVDLDGDGFADLYDAQNGVILHGTGAATWRVENASFTTPDMGTGSNFTFTDMDGDREIDIFYADGTDTYYLRNTGGRFATTPTIPTPPDSSYVVNVDVGVASGLQLADMNGDGLSDAVFVNTAGLVAYRVNYGRGLFGADVVEMTGLSPNTVPGQLKLVDINGDGMSDGVIVAPGQVSVFLNRNGAVFGTRVDITQGVPAGTAAEHQVRFADMTGDGSVDVVWVNAAGNVIYLDFYQVRPNLLTRIENGLGKIIDVKYGTAARHMARDGGPSAWRYRLPHPMLTVDGMDTWDEFTNLHQVIEVEYANGYYDGVEDRFRGFESTVVYTRGDSTVETGRATSEYDVGATDPYHSSLLMMQRTESERAGAFIVLEEVHHEYDDCVIAGVPTTTTPRVRWVCATAQVTRVVEGAAPAAVPELRTETIYDGNGNKVLESNLGVVSIGGAACPACTRGAAVMGAPCGPQCLGDESFVENLYVAPTATGRWLLNKPMVRTARGIRGSDTFVEKHYHYDGEDFVGLPLGELTRGSLTRVSERVRSGEDTFVDSQRLAKGATGEVVRSLDANGLLSTLEYDAFRFLTTSEEKHLATGGYTLKTTVQHHPVMDAIVSVVPWRRHENGAPVGPARETRYAYDRFGRMVAKAAPGDDLANPTERFEYDLRSPVSAITTRKRSAAAPSTEFDLMARSCLDGMGRSIHNLVRLGVGRALVTDFNVQNTRGTVAWAYQNFETDSEDCLSSPPAWVSRAERTYDAKGRLIRELRPDAAIHAGVASVEATVYGPLSVTVLDANDNAEPSRASPVVTFLDGLARPVRIEHRAPDPAQVMTFDITYDQLGNVRGSVDAAGAERVQEYDLLGRIVRLVDADQGTRTNEYDARGNRVRYVDGRGKVTRYEYDELSRPLASYDEADETGTRLSMHYDRLADCTVDCDAEGRLTNVTYPRGRERIVHDARNRPILVERELDGHAAAITNTYDNVDRIRSKGFPGGERFEYTLDGLGRVASIKDLVTRIDYDAKSMPSAVHYANNTAIHYTSDALNRVSSIEVRGTADEVLFGQALTWDRNNNLVGIVESGGTEGRPTSTATYQYDPHNRLAQAALEAPGAASAETLTFTYDRLDRPLTRVSDRGAASPHHVGAYAYASASSRRAVSAGATSLAYDAAGNVTSLGDADVQWDHLGRLTAVSVGGSVITRHVYGAGNARVIRERGGVLSYFYDPEFEVHDGVARISATIGTHVVATITSAALAASYLPDAAPRSAPDGRITSADAFALHASGDPGWEGALVASVLTTLAAGNTGRAVEYVYHDYLGSPALRLDETGANPVHTTHGPFGEVRSNLREASLFAWVDRGFAGQEFEDQLGLVHFGTREYSPRLGLFLSADSAFDVLDKDTVPQARVAHGRYIFALNNPSSYRDEQGKNPAMIIGLIVGALIGAATPLLEAGIEQFRDHGTHFDQWEWTGEHGVFSKEHLMEAGWGALTEAAMGAITSGASTGEAIGKLLLHAGKEVLLALAPRIVELVAEKLGATRDEANAIGDILDMLVLGKDLNHIMHAAHSDKFVNLMERSMKNFKDNAKLVGVVAAGMNKTYHAVYEVMHNLGHGQIGEAWEYTKRNWKGVLLMGIPGGAVIAPAFFSKPPEGEGGAKHGGGH